MRAEQWLKHWVSRHPQDFRSSIEVGSSGCFVSTDNSTNSKIWFLNEIVDSSGINQANLKIEVKFNK